MNGKYFEFIPVFGSCFWNRMTKGTLIKKVAFASALFLFLVFIYCAALAQVELTLEKITGIDYSPDREDYYSHASISPNGEKIIITSFYLDKGTRFLESIKSDSVWSEPIPVTLINHVKGDLQWHSIASFNADGNTIYFHATFQDSYGSQDIYSSTLADGTWQSPVNLGTIINSKDSEMSPWISPDNKRLYFTKGVADKKDRILRIYFSEKKPNGNWGIPKIWFENLKFDHTENPIVFRDNAMFLYAMEKKKSDHDIYLSVLRAENEWTVPLLIRYKKSEFDKFEIWKWSRSVRVFTTTADFNYLYVCLNGKLYRSPVNPEMKILVDNAYSANGSTNLPTINPMVVQSIPKTTHKENKTALVIGNADYSESKLKNPTNDAIIISEELKRAGFNVITHTDIDLESMKEAIRNFGDQLVKNPGVGLFYFAGHGLQSKGINYLVPIDANIERQYDIEDECMRADRVFRMMELYDNPMNLVILDACRNNPYTSKFRSLNQGLAQPEQAPTGSIIAFATAPGKTASDGTGENGLYTQELIKAIRMPGLKIEEIFKQTRVNVLELSNGKQSPWENSSLIGDFYFYK